MLWYSPSTKNRLHLAQIVKVGEGKAARSFGLARYRDIEPLTLAESPLKGPRVPFSSGRMIVASNETSVRPPLKGQ